MKQNNEFDGIEIPDDRANALAAAIIRDSVLSYAGSLIRLKLIPETKAQRAKHADDLRNKIDCENFFQSKWYVFLAESINFRIKGKDIINMVKRNPRKYYVQLYNTIYAAVYAALNKSKEDFKI